MHAHKSLAITLAAFTLALIALPAVAAEDVVNINEADASQLALLPRIGPALAERIVMDLKMATFGVINTPSPSRRTGR